jgi:serine/threonine protein kinase
MPMPNLIGQSLGRYHSLEQLGEGGMATVYRAYDTRLERDVAIKVIRRDAFPPDQLDRILKRFEREAKALARLSHPNIVKVHDFGEYEGAPYLVMEYLPGGTLKEKMGMPTSWQAAASLLIPVAHALNYAHLQGILHRDVKPANILITATGEPMLTDFGIAKILDIKETNTLTGTGVGIGTPEYMAPEQCVGGSVDARADVYSLGIIFYELVIGRKPYTADTPMAVVIKQINEPLPPPRQFVPGLPDKVERVLLKVLSKEPDNRFPDMGAFATALESLSEYSKSDTHSFPSEEMTRAAFGPPAGRIPMPEPPQSPPRWRRWIAIGAILISACVLIAALGIALLILGQKGNGPLARQAASTPYFTFTPSMSTTYTLTTSQALTFTPTRIPGPILISVGCPIKNWSVLGSGTWNCNGDMVLGHSVNGDGLLISRDIYADMTLSAQVSSQNREASLVIRVQDAANFYLVVFEPDGISWNNGVGGIWLVKRVNNVDTNLGYYHAAGFPMLGEQAQLSIEAEGSRIIVMINQKIGIQLNDSTFSSGYAGLRIFGDNRLPCDATFQNITIQYNS